MESPSDRTRIGRPPRQYPSYNQVRQSLLRCGVEMLTEHGFSSCGLDGMLRRANVPKGSFRHYFKNKEAFGLEVIEVYDSWFCTKLDQWLQDDRHSELERLRLLVEDTKLHMSRHAFVRGSLVGNLAKEVATLPAGFQQRLTDISDGWKNRVAECLRAAQRKNHISAAASCGALADFFWIGWEGAILRARLVKSTTPLDNFIQQFLAGVPRSSTALSHAASD